MDLREFFNKYPLVAVAFSGGVDSAYLLYEAKQYAREVKAYYVKSTFQPQFELDDAIRFAKEYDINMEIISLDVLCDEQVISNPQNRCYYCKKKIFSEILLRAKADGFSIVLDGTNASDDINDRPGTKALTELSVLSPLRMCNLTKDEIRAKSKEIGLFTYDKPSYACLATRIPTGHAIDSELLRKTEEAEIFMASLGFTNFRVRNDGTTARIEVIDRQIPLLLENRETIYERLHRDYKKVYLDLEVRDEHRD